MERTYIVPLRSGWLKAPKYRRAKKAVSTLREFLVRHMKSEEIRIKPELNQAIWTDGIKSPPARIKINVVKDDQGIVTAQLFGKPLGIEVKDDKKKKAKKAAAKPKTEEKPAEQEEKAKKPTEEKVKEEAKKEAPKAEEKVEKAPVKKEEKAAKEAPKKAVSKESAKPEVTEKKEPVKSEAKEEKPAK